MLKSLVQSLDYQRDLSKFSSLDSLVDQQVIKEHKMKDRDFMKIVKKGEEALSQYLKILKLKVSVSPETKILLDAVIKKEGYDSYSVEEILEIAVAPLKNPFKFDSFDHDEYRFYIPQNTLDLYCASILFGNCTYGSRSSTKKGVQERMFILKEGKLVGIFTRYYDLKKPAWALTERYSQPFRCPIVELKLTELNLISNKTIRVWDAQQYWGLL